MFWRNTEIGSLLAASLILVATFAVNALSSVPNHQKFGFKYTIANVSRMFSTEITPADYTFAIWGLIYILQIVWLVYGWSFVCRQSVPSAISPFTYFAYCIVNLTNIAWIYVWDNILIEVASGVLFASAISLYVTLGSAAYFLYKQTPALAKDSPTDLYVARILVLNSLAVYATWVTIASLIGLTTVLQYFTALGAVNAGTVSLVALALFLALYFALENTILDRYLRYVGIVYPVVIWALSGVLVAHWGATDEGPNPVLTLILLVAAVFVFLARIGLWTIFAKFRPLETPAKTVEASIV